MALKTLLVAFSTTREVDGVDKRVRYASGSVVDLTDEELDSLTKLQNATGKLHFREPVKEGGQIAESKPAVVAVPDYAGQDVPLDKKSVDQLKAHLDFHNVSYDSKASKADLLAAAQTKPADDQDGGL